MAKKSAGMTVAQLEKALVARKTRLAKLIKRRTALQKSLAKVEKQIQQVGGRESAQGKTRRRRRPKNKKSLRAYVVEILTRSKKGLTIRELNERVAKTDYKSRSANFKNVLYQTLYNSDEVVHDKESGKYTLKG